MGSAVSFDGRGCEEWSLKLKVFNIPMPEVKTNYIDIPGADDSVDATEIFGKVFYKNRENVSFTFDYLGDYTSWQTNISDFANYLHGQKRKVVIDYDSGYYYEGRFSIDPTKTNVVQGTVVVTGKLNAYKYEAFSSLEDWGWDPLDFDTGVIREYAGLTVDGTMEVTVIGSRMPVVPIITASTAMTVKFEGQTYQLSAGDNEIPEIEIFDGENILTFTGTGTVSIDYRGGSL